MCGVRDTLFEAPLRVNTIPSRGRHLLAPFLFVKMVLGMVFEAYGNTSYSHKYPLQLNSKRDGKTAESWSVQEYLARQTRRRLGILQVSTSRGDRKLPPKWQFFEPEPRLVAAPIEIAPQVFLSRYQLWNYINDGNAPNGTRRVRKNESGLMPKGVVLMNFS